MNFTTPMIWFSLTQNSNLIKVLLKLQAENKELQEKVEFLTKYDADVDGLQAENAWLKEALKKYGQHSKVCRTRPPCDIYSCGLEQALKD